MLCLQNFYSKTFDLVFSLGPRSHRTPEQICMQICVQTLWCCLCAGWTLPLTTMPLLSCCEVLCVLCELGQANARNNYALTASWSKAHKRVHIRFHGTEPCLLRLLGSSRSVFQKGRGPENCQLSICIQNPKVCMEFQRDDILFMSGG